MQYSLKATHFLPYKISTILMHWIILEDQCAMVHPRYFYELIQSFDKQLAKHKVSACASTGPTYVQYVHTAHK